MYIHQLVFGVGPYLAGTIFILGSILRYERGQYTWRAMSSQMLHNTRTYRVGNLLFHHPSCHGSNFAPARHPLQTTAIPVVSIVPTASGEQL